jgi:hypothetical protein
MTRDLRPLFQPDGVAIVGASDDPVKWGNWLARGALRGEHRRPVHLVNRRGGEVMGRPAFRSLAELPEPPALAVLAVPPAVLEQTVDEAIAAGARRSSSSRPASPTATPAARATARWRSGRVRPGSYCSAPTASACSTPARSSSWCPTTSRAARSASSRRAATSRSRSA